MASLHHQLGRQDIDSCKRRFLLILGISIFPFLPRKNEAFEVCAVEDEQGSRKEIQKLEQTGQKGAPSNPFVSLLNAIGVFSSGVLAALYSLARKDKVKSEAMMESLNFQLKQKDALITSLEENFEVKLLYQEEEHNKLLNKAKEEQLSLTNRLELANSTIAGLGHELQIERREIGELHVQIGNLEMELEEAGKDKQVLEDEVKEKHSSIAVLQDKIIVLTSEMKEKDGAINSLNSSLVQERSGLTALHSAYKQTRDELDARTLEIANLRDELMKSQNELEQKNWVIDDLGNRVNSLITERDKLTAKVNALEHEYNDLKSSSEEKAASDAKLLGERDHELAQLKEKYELIVSEVNAKQAVISDLTQDQDNLKRMLNIEGDNVKSLKQELQLVETSLRSSRNEVSNLNKQLNESRKLCSEMEAALSKVQAEFSQARESLQKTLDEARMHSKAQARELTSAKEALNKTENELQVVSNELASTAENRDKLQKELVEMYKKAEEATNELKEEKKMVASLKNELEALENQMLKEREVRKSLERDLEEATRSLDEISSNALILSKELEVSKTRISNLEEEKDFLNNALEKERELAQEARENLEDVRSVVMKLGIERESLAKRAKKLEQDLAFAKGEILRLRSQVNSSKTVTKSRPNQESEVVINGEPVKQETEPAGAAPVKKTRRRKKIVSEE